MKTKNILRHFISIFVLIFLLVLAVGSTGSSSSTPSIKMNSIMKITNSTGKVMGCIHKDYYEKIFKYLTQGDKEAATKLLNAGFTTGECTPFELGEAVYIDDFKPLSSYVKIRRQGETVAYWTFDNAFK